MASASPGQAAPAAWGTAFGLNRCGSLPQRERRETSAPSFGALQLVPGVLILGSLFPLPGGSRLAGAPGPRTLCGLSCLRTQGGTRSACAATRRSLRGEWLWVRGALLCVSTRCCCAGSDVLGSGRGDEQKITSGSFLLKKEKQEYKKAQKIFWGNLCFGIPTSRPPGARQRLTSSK